MGRIWLEARVEPFNVVAIVRDNGPGIGIELLPRLFKFFEQGESSIDRARGGKGNLGGLGIGLALVKSFVELHDGKVELTSPAAAPGAEFMVTLPVSLEAAAVDVVTTVPPARPANAQTVRVMVVDDNVDAAESTAAVLGLNGLHVAVAFDPNQALALLQSFDPTVAIIDIGLPIMDGYKLAAERAVELAHGRCASLRCPGTVRRAISAHHGASDSSVIS